MESTSSPNNDQQQPSKGSTQHRTQRAVYGRSSVNTAGIVAANKLIKKAVYCIDNIDVSFNVEDIVHYVTSQGISVVSCFETKPRVRRYDNYANVRKAFRLCINDDHRHLLLDSSNRPDSVIVSEWFFKSQQPAKKSRDAPLDKRLRAHQSPSHHRLPYEDQSSSRNTADLVVNNGTSIAEVHAVEDMDLTIITQDSINDTALPSNSLTITSNDQ